MCFTFTFSPSFLFLPHRPHLRVYTCTHDCVFILFFSHVFVLTNTVLQKWLMEDGKEQVHVYTCTLYSTHTCIYMIITGFPWSAYISPSFQMVYEAPLETLISATVAQRGWVGHMHTPLLSVMLCSLCALFSLILSSMGGKCPLFLSPCGL